MPRERLAQEAVIQQQNHYRTPLYVRTFRSSDHLNENFQGIDNTEDHIEEVRLTEVVQSGPAMDVLFDEEIREHARWSAD